jgi:hypothetical protein
VSDSIVRRNLAFRSLALVALVLFLIGFVLTGYGLYIESQARGLLNDLTSLKSGQSTGVQAQEFIRRHQRWAFKTSSPCDGNTCVGSFRIYNTWLSELRLEPPAMFQADVSVSHGIVDYIGVSLFRYMPIFPTFQASAGDVIETVELPRYYPTHDHYFVPTPIGKPYLRISLDSHATPIRRQRAFNFSFRCLVKPGGGCDLPCDYLPAAFQDWKVSILHAGVPVDFDRAYPNNARCEQ